MSFTLTGKYGDPSLFYVFGNWSPVKGIEYRLDSLNQPIILYLNGVLGMLLILARNLIDKTVTRYIDSKKQHLFYSLLLFAHAGYLGVLSTNDLFNMYVFIEISSLAAYVLISKGNNSGALVGAFDYLILGSIGATLVLIAIGLLLSMTGSLNISDIFSIIQNPEIKVDPNIMLVAIVFFLSGIILKMAFFPLHFWMARAYSTTAPIMLTYLAAVSGLLGIYMILRFLHFVVDVELVYMPISLILKNLSLITLVICPYLAVRTKDIREILVYSVATQTGYIFLLLTLGSAQGLLFQLLFLDSINKIGLFMVLAHLEYHKNHVNIKMMKKIVHSAGFKVLSALIILFSSSLPLTGMFFIKVKIFDFLVRQNLLIEFIVVIIASILGLLYHLNLAKAIFFGKEENGIIEIKTGLASLVGVVLIQLATLIV